MLHIVKPLLRRPLMPLLVALQVALACAIACNTLFLLQQKLAPILAPTGIGNPSRLVILHGMFPVGTAWSAARMRGLDAKLQQVAGVRMVSYAASLPMASEAHITEDVGGPAPRPSMGAVLYIGDNLVKTLGLHLVAGRDFTSEEKDVTVSRSMDAHAPGAAIITRSLARRLFPDGRAAGKLLPDSNTTVVGVVAHMISNDITQSGRNLDYTVLQPGVVQRWPGPMFAVRLDTSDAGSICKAMVALVQHELGPRMLAGHQARCSPFPQLTDRMLAPQRAAVWLLSGVTLIVLVVTLTGIMGMTGYWVQQRTRSIGIRRALGAKRRDVLRELLIENLLVVGSGVVIGLIAACGINLWLMRHYELLRLPWMYLPVGAALLLALGQLAVLMPARRASRISPMVATRAI